MSRRRPQITSAHLLAGAALFVSLSGTSYAVSKVAKNSVGSEQVKDGSLQTVDLGAGVSISGPRGPRGAEGPQGPAGAQVRRCVIQQPKNAQRDPCAINKNAKLR